MKQKTNISILLAFIICTSVWSQELKKKKNAAFYYHEKYTIDKKTKKKHGAYVRIADASKDTLAKGNFNQGSKTGKWSYYSKKNILYLIYDYEQKKFFHKAHRFIDGDSVQIKFKNIYKVDKVQETAIYLGDQNEIVNTLNISFQPPKTAFENNISGMVMASFDINKMGEMENFKIETSYDKKLEKPARESLEKFKHDWVPALINGKPVTSKMYVLFNINFVTPTSVEPKKLASNKSDMIIVNFTYLGISRQVTKKSLGYRYMPINRSSFIEF